MGVLPLLAMMLGLPVPGTTMLGRGADFATPAAQGPSTVPISATADPIVSTSTRPADKFSENRGRRIFSTAFVRMGPGGHLSVRHYDGRELVLRDVTMRAKVFCGRLVSGEAMGKIYCGNFADVAAAQPDSGDVFLPENLDIDSVVLDREAKPKLPK